MTNSGDIMKGGTIVAKAGTYLIVVAAGGGNIRGQ
jgi:hypothetical protein